MKKILNFLILFLFSINSVIASDIKFIQIDSLKFSSASEHAVNDFKNLIDDINKQKNVNFIIFSGDNIAESNKVFLKEFLKCANKLKMPYYIALGHKDVNKNKGLSKLDYMNNVKKYSHNKFNSPNYSFTKGNVAFIVADGSKEFIATPFGYYKDDVVDWLNQEITKFSKKNVIILQHFPIYPPAEKEAYYTYKADEYIKMLSNHKNVKAVISGFGINSENYFNGIKHISTASYPKYRIVEVFDADTNEPTIWSTLK